MTDKLDRISKWAGEVSGQSPWVRPKRSQS